MVDATGGDGVHYGFLYDETTNVRTGVVMTVPMAAEPCYDHADTIAWLQTSDQGLRDAGGNLLAELTSAFGLQPWSDVAGRLSDLETRLLPTVYIGPGAF